MSDTPLETVVEIFSPVPPMRTGTADYLDMVLKRVSAVPGCAPRISIAVDPDCAPSDMPLPGSLHGARVEDYRNFSDVVPIGRTRIFFLANNDYHAYVYSALSRQRSLAHGRVISVIHDPSTFMVHRFRLGNSNCRLTEADLVTAASLQYKQLTSRFVSARLNGAMPDIFEYVTNCQQAALTNSHEVWVHSLFAMAKLICESDVHATQLPTIRLCAHPNRRAEPEGEPEPAANRFRIGCFGWITPNKRIAAVLHGLALALDRLPGEAQDRIELMVVGPKPADSMYDFGSIAAQFDIAHIVRTIDYPATDEFHRLQISCHLIFNLRYPSCGETSGTLSSARSTGARIVTSRYQAFHEASSGCTTVTTLPGFEKCEIASVICAAYFDWQQGNIMVPREQETRETASSIEKLLLYEVISQANVIRLRGLPEEAL